MAFSQVLKEFGFVLDIKFDKKKAEEAKKAIDELKHQVKEIALHAAEAAGAIFEFANIAGEHSRSLEENSEMLGINVERLQELQYAAKVAANATGEDLVGALESVSTTLDKARHSDVLASESLIRLGVPIDMITNKSITADQVLLQLSDSFKNIHDPIAKTRLATEIFGSAGAKLLPLLNKGAAGIAAMGKEARDLGVVLSKDVVEQGAEFDRQFSKVWIVLKNITYLIGNELIKYLKPMVTEFQRFVVANKQLIASNIVIVMKALGEYLSIIFKVAKFVADRFMYLVHVLGGLDKVARAIGIAFGILTGLKIISGLGTLLQSFRAIALVMTGISLQASLIGAAFLAVILVVQDLFSDDSIIKEWFATLEAQYPTLKKFADLLLKMSDLSSSVFEGKTNESKGFFSGIADGWEALKSKNFADFNPFGDMQVSSASPGVAASAGGGNQVSVTQNISVPPGTTAGVAAKMVGDGLSDALNPMLRQTRNQALGGLAY